MTWKTSTTVAVIYMYSLAQAKITNDGLWDGNDWYDDNVKIGV